MDSQCRAIPRPRSPRRSRSWTICRKTWIGSRSRRADSSVAAHGLLVGVADPDRSPEMLARIAFDIPLQELRAIDCGLPDRDERSRLVGNQVMEAADAELRQMREVFVTSLTRQRQAGG